MFSYGFYNSMQGDRKYNAEQISSIFDGIIEDGVYANVGEALMVVPGTGMQVIVKTGRAWFKHTWSLNDTYMPLAIETADQYRSRIDAVVIEVNHGTRMNGIKVIKGVPAVSPAKPAMAHEANLDQFALAYVTVDAEATAITEAKIEIAVGKNETPFVQCPLKTVSISDLFNQWEGEFNEWFENLQAQLTDNIVTNLQNQIDQRVKLSDKATPQDIKNKVPGKWVDAENYSENLNPVIGSIAYSTVNLEEKYPGEYMLCDGRTVSVKDNPTLKKALYDRWDKPRPLLYSRSEKQDFIGNSYSMLYGSPWLTKTTVCSMYGAGGSDSIRIYDIEKGKHIVTISNTFSAANINHRLYVFIKENSSSTSIVSVEEYDYDGNKLATYNFSTSIRATGNYYIYGYEDTEKGIVFYGQFASSTGLLGQGRLYLENGTATLALTTTSITLSSSGCGYYDSGYIYLFQYVSATWNLYSIDLITGITNKLSTFSASGSKVYGYTSKNSRSLYYITGPEENFKVEKIYFVSPTETTTDVLYEGSLPTILLDSSASASYTLIEDRYIYGTNRLILDLVTGEIRINDHYYNGGDNRNSYYSYDGKVFGYYLLNSRDLSYLNECSVEMNSINKSDVLLSFGEDTTTCIPLVYIDSYVYSISDDKVIFFVAEYDIIYTMVKTVSNNVPVLIKPCSVDLSKRRLPRIPNAYIRISTQSAD